MIYPSANSIQAELQALENEVRQCSNEIGHWACYVTNTKRNREAMLMLFTARQMCETLMARLWQAEINLITATRELEHWHINGHEPMRDVPQPLH